MSRRLGSRKTSPERLLAIDIWSAWRDAGYAGLIDHDTATTLVFGMVDVSKEYAGKDYVSLASLALKYAIAQRKADK